MNEIQELNRIRINHDIGYTWLAEQLNKKYPGANYSRGRLYYIFVEGKNISLSVYREIKSIFDEYNFKDNDIETDSLSMQVAELNCQSASLTKNIIKSVEDDVITKKEKKILVKELEILKKKIREIEEELGQ